MGAPEPQPLDDASRIEGWKAIAQYFGRGVRTVQDWQSEGLPVQRFKKRVWAIESELAEWRRAREGQQEGKAVTPIQAPPLAEHRASSFRPRWAAGGALALAALVATWTAVSYVNRPGNPAHCTAEGMLLRVFDAHNRQLWEFPLPSPLMPGRAPNDPLAAFADFDGDGRNEVLFVHSSRTSAQDGSALYCFRADGSVAWKRNMGRRLVTRAGQQLGPNYNPVRLAVLAKPRPDGGRIVVASNHAWSWPSQVALLTAGGELASEYWHPGWIEAMALADINEDGTEEIVLGGVNNSCGQTAEGDFGAALVVLDSRKAAGFGLGCSPHWGVPGIPTASEMAVLQFHEPTHPGLAQAYYRVARVRVVGGQVELDVENNQAPSTGNVIYRLDRRLGIAAITPDGVVSASLLAGLQLSEGRATVQQKLGRVKVLRNVFAAGESGPG